MKNKLPCELIRDLFPSYIDDLTSDITNELVEEHLAECEDCHRVLDSMKDCFVEPPDTKEEKEIDFLKKTRKKTEGFMIGSILTAVLVMVICLVIRNYFIGTDVCSDYVACDVSVNGNVLSVTGAIADTALGISDVTFAEEDGVVTLSFKGVRRSPFHDRFFEKEYVADKVISEVRLDERIVWAGGENISPITSSVYNTRHLYIGDMSKNGRTAGALNISYYLGNFTNELQTVEEPYGWKLIFQNSFSANRKTGMEKDMRSYAYVMLAVIGNLGEVSYEYTIDGELCELTVTEEEATAFAGQNIKAIGEDVAALQKLIEQTGLTNMSYVSDGSQWHTQDTIQLEMVNFTEEEISGIGVSYYLDGKLYGTQGAEYADGTLIQKGEIMRVTFIPDDFGGEEWPGKREVVIQVAVTDKAGNTYDVPEQVRVGAEFGCSYRYEISGNATEGYIIGQ